MQATTVRRYDGTTLRRYDVMVDVMQISLGGKMQISLKLELCRANQDQIRNQRPRLRRNRLVLGRKEGGFPTSAIFSTIYTIFYYFRNSLTILYGEIYLLIVTFLQKFTHYFRLL